MCEPVYRA
ncbi:hypothetical protein YPPY88_0393, partial [Yersinia pestis PY-88]